MYQKISTGQERDGEAKENGGGTGQKGGNCNGKLHARWMGWWRCSCMMRNRYLQLIPGFILFYFFEKRFAKTFTGKLQAGFLWACLPRHLCNKNAFVLEGN